MNILKRPIITEKSLKRGKVGIYVFEVEKKSKKSQIKKEIEKLEALMQSPLFWDDKVRAQNVLKELGNLWEY